MSYYNIAKFVFQVLQFPYLQSELSMLFYS